MTSIVNEFACAQGEHVWATPVMNKAVRRARRTDISRYSEWWHRDWWRHSCTHCGVTRRDARTSQNLLP